MSEQAGQSRTLQDHDLLRQRLVRRLTAATMATLLVVCPLILVRSLALGFKFVTAVQSMIVCFLLGIFLGRNRLKPRISALALFVALFAWAMVAIGNYGVLAPSNLLVPFLTVFSSIVLGRRVALWLFGVLTLGMVVLGALYLSGAVRYQVDVPAFVHSWTCWTNVVVLQAVLALWYLFMIAPINEVQSELSQRLDAVLQGINDALFIHDKDTGAILQVNQKMCDLYRCSAEEALRLNVGELSTGIAPYDLEHARAWMGKAALEGPQLFEWQARDCQGRAFWVEVNMRLATLDGTQRILVVTRDISARKQAERDMAAVQANLAALIECTDDLIWSVDLDYKCLTFNRHVQEHIRQAHGKEISVGARVDELLSPERAAFWTSLYCRTLEEGSFRQEVILSDGKTYELTMNPVVNGAEKVGVSVFARDTTQRKRAEEEQRQMQMRLDQAQKMEAIGTLAGGIAHDFNNILGAIIGCTELALMELPADSPAKALLEDVERGGARAVELVKQILTFSRRTPLEKKPIQPLLVVKEALKLLRASLPATIVIREQCSSDGWILADAGQIHQIVMNLCTNAGLAMCESGGTLEVGLREMDGNAALLAQYVDLTPGRYICLTVKDTGGGIVPENLPRIFEPFFTTRPIGEGTGLGLSVVHGIVKSWGGAIGVTSELGRGTTFDVWLPICEAPAVPVVDRSSACHGHARVLFVDDEVDLTEVARRGLERFGYQVTAFHDPQAARNAFRTTPEDFDIVITDMTMPGLTGDVLAAEVKALRSDIPVVLVSGFSDRFTAEHARAAGFDGFIDKPVRPATLAHLIHRLCHRR